MGELEDSRPPLRLSLDVNTSCQSHVESPQKPFFSLMPVLDAETPAITDSHVMKEINFLQKIGAEKLPPLQRVNSDSERTQVDQCGSRK
jgi:hypothetical protein